MARPLRTERVGRRFHASARDNTPVVGQQFGYSFDQIGNRLWTADDGRLAAYNHNFLNQISSRDVPGWVWCLGEAHPNATVTLWGDNGGWSKTRRQGNYFAGELVVQNTAAAVCLTITNLAVLQDGVNPDHVAIETRQSIVLQHQEEFLYDLDGNLGSDGKWSYRWDAENRLIGVESLLESIPNSAKKKLAFAYDHQGRRIEKVVYANTGGVYVPAYTNRFVYDGWNLIAVLAADQSPLLSFAWGTDMSGTMQGAGGVGGLLSITEHTGPNAGTYFCCYDGNGNVVALVNAANGDLAARYEYGPFGEVIRATGPMAKANPIRWSTKYTDDETDLVMYPYRPYSPSLGRWLSRDPVEETGGQNLYGFCSNNSVNLFDLDGRFTYSTCSVCGQNYQGVHVDCPGRPIPRPPTVFQKGKCSNPDVTSAIALANTAMQRSKCAKWFADHGAKGEFWGLTCYGCWKPACWYSGLEAWTYPGTGIGVCENNVKKYGPAGIASLIIHEAAHHYCPVFGGESCAESAQEACGN